MKIYIAGPYTRGDTAQNVRNAIVAGNNVAALGHTPYIPHLTHFWHMLIPRPIEFWYRFDIEWLKVCDAVLRLPGESKGADEEVRIAKDMDKPVYENFADIPRARGLVSE